jgi:hypothetical protein
MTLSITRPGAWRLRSCALVFTLALFAPLAIPATASASGVPNIPVSNYVFTPFGNEFVNDVSASSPAQGNPAFQAKFELGIGVSPTVKAVQNVTATAQCAGCTAIAVGFQIVTATLPYITKVEQDDVTLATDGACSPGCTAAALGYQIIVGTNTGGPLSFVELLSRSQMQQLDTIRSEVLALPNSGLSIAGIQSECQDLLSQVVSILQSASYPSFSSFSLPTFSPAIHGVGLATEPTSGSSHPIVKWFKSTHFFPVSAG